MWGCNIRQICGPNLWATVTLTFLSFSDLKAKRRKHMGLGSLQELAAGILLASQKDFSSCKLKLMERQMYFN